jgi:hypothetical protein
LDSPTNNLLYFRRMSVILLPEKPFRFDKAASWKKLWTHLDRHSAKPFQRSGKK